MCLPGREEGESGLNKREEGNPGMQGKKEREMASACSQTLCAYSALNAALRRFQLWDDSLDIFMLIFLEEEEEE